MNMKREDFEIVRSFEDKLFLGLRVDYFDEEPEPVIETLLQGTEPPEETIGILPEPEPTEEELAIIEKENKKAELLAKLAELEE